MNEQCIRLQLRYLMPCTCCILPTITEIVERFPQLSTSQSVKKRQDLCRNVHKTTKFLWTQDKTRRRKGMNNECIINFLFVIPLDLNELSSAPTFLNISKKSAMHINANAVDCTLNNLLIHQLPVHAILL